MYKTGIVNNFYRELFSTEYCDAASTTQNAKTDLIFELTLDGSDESFEKWFECLVDCYADDCDINKTALLKAISNCPEFKKDMREEFDQLLEDYEDDEDEFYEDEE